MKVEDFAGSEPAFAPESYFAGETKAWGFFQDRFGRIRREFTVDIHGTFDGATLKLDEDFVYRDGERDNRVWLIRKLPDGSYEGTADDIVGVAKGRTSGRAMNWVYEFDLPMGDRKLRATFDDWMFLQDDEVMLNRTTVSKLGIRLGEVVLFFRKVPASGAGGEAPANHPEQPAQ